MAAVALAEILLNNENAGGKLLGGILRAALGLNPMQLMMLRVMGTPVLGSAEIWAGDGEFWSKTGDISQIG